MDRVVGDGGDGGVPSGMNGWTCSLPLACCDLGGVKWAAKGVEGEGKMLDGL